MIAPESGQTEPIVYTLIPDKDFLVISQAADVPLPDDEELEELCIQADQRCAPPTLGPASEAAVTLAELVAGGLVTNAATAGYPALRGYLSRLIPVLKHGGQAIPAPAEPVEAAVTGVERAVRAAVGEPAEEVRLASTGGPALGAVVRVKDDILVDVRSDATGTVVSITICGERP